MTHLLDAGVSPLLGFEDGNSAYEAAMGIPEVAQMFKGACQRFDNEMQSFTPAADTLIGSDNQPTELMRYCCCAGRVGEILAADRWPDARELVSVKRALGTALPADYVKKYDAELDPSAARRTQAGKNPFTRPPAHGFGGQL